MSHKKRYDLVKEEEASVQDEIRELRAAIEDLSAILMGALTKEPVAPLTDREDR